MSSTGQQIGRSPKVEYVETLRGIACILLVSYHVIGDTSLNGLQLSDQHPLAFVNRLFVDVRMPLFSFISGYVFSTFARDLPMLGGKVTSKVRRLLIPMAVVGSLHYWAQFAFTSQPGHVPFYHLFFLPYEHFWFLQATFLLMLILLVLTYLLKGDGNRAALLLLVPAVIGGIAISRWHPDIFSSYKALYLAPYFLTGYLISHSESWKGTVEAWSQRNGLVIALGILLLGLFFVEFMILDQWIEVMGAERRAIALSVGLMTCLFFFVLRFKARLLTFIGDKSYAIFLFHVFFTAGSRIVLQKLFPTIDIWPLFIIGLIAGLAGPMLVHWVALRHPLSALLLLGIRTPAGRSAMLRTSGSL